VLAFAYILVVVIIGLGVPLTVNLQRRATAELETNALVTAQGIAGAIDPNRIDRTVEMSELARDAAARSNVRVVVVDSAGIVSGDSDGIAVGETYAERGRPEILLALDGQPESIIRMSQDLGRDIMATAVPVVDEDERRVVGAVRITQDVQQVSDNVRRTTLGLLAIGAAGLVAGLILAFSLAGSLSRPLTKLAGAARRLGSGDLGARTELEGGASEIEELARAFDDMAGRLERTVRAQREFVANASHQLRTPLTGMKLRLESAIAEAEDDDAKQRLEAAEREVDRLSEIVARLLVTATAVEEGRPTRVDLDNAIERAVTRWEERATRASAKLSARGDAGRAEGNPSDVDQILDNLLDNAISYAPGDVTIEAGRRDTSAIVAVEDRGPGIREEDVARVTERFYRGTDASRGGSGLGLAIARDLAEKWGGSIEVTSEVGRGTRVEVRLRALKD
jgi:two-component system, OmpR family, sensor kinase